MDLSPEARRASFVGLAVAAVIVVLVAIGTVITAPVNAKAWLIGCVIALILVVLAEVVLLLLAREPPAPTQDEEPIYEMEMDPEPEARQ